jgi:nucleoside-diphosphate-sugar epimerase
MTKPHILFTGGAGDLGRRVTEQFLRRGDKVTSLDLTAHTIDGAHVIAGSVSDRSVVATALTGVTTVIHSAAWHGIHEFRQLKGATEFWDVNMTGTFNLLQGCVEAGVKRFVFISSTSIDEWPSMYGLTKLLGEELARGYAFANGMQIVALRPRGFIPWDNTWVYPSFLDWARWFARGAVHIDDVVRAVLNAVDYVGTQSTAVFESIEIDGKHDLTPEDISYWRAHGWQEFLRHRFPHVVSDLLKIDFSPTEPPTYKSLERARSILGYHPTYGFEELINEIIRRHPSGEAQAVSQGMQ